MPRAKKRPQRTPVGRRNVLTVDERPNYVRRVVNDEGDGARIKMFEDAGYTPVQHKAPIGDPNVGEATQVGNVMRKPVGGGKTAVVMEIPKEYYDEDQAAKEALIQAKERGMLAGDADNAPNQNLLYGDGVTIKRPAVQIESEE